MMAEIGPAANLGSSPAPLKVLFRPPRSPDSTQLSPIFADEPVGQRLQVLRNPNEVNNVNLHNRRRIGTISRASLS